jgi:hypothetical protein
MKLIFLDVDGVLSTFGMRGLCGERLDLFADVVRRTGAEVVLSSTWRYPHCQEQRLRLQQELGKRGVELFGETPMAQEISGSSLLQATMRGDEIQAYLTACQRRHAIEAFAILDDDPNDEMGALKPHLIKCDGYTGLTPALAESLVAALTAPPAGLRLASPPDRGQ